MFLLTGFSIGLLMQKRKCIIDLCLPQISLKYISAFKTANLKIIINKRASFSNTGDTCKQILL